MIAVLKRKLQTLKQNPSHALKDKLLSGVSRAWYYYHWITDRNVNHSPKEPPEFYKELFRTAGAYNVIQQFISSRPSNSIAPDYSDLWFLYSTVRKRRPRVLLEFGSGVSTAILAKAIKDNKSGFLYSVDAIEQWGDSTRNCMPQSLQGSYEIFYRPAKEVTHYCEQCWAGVRVFRHERIPEIVPDFIYLDGPPGTSDVSIPIGIDVLDMEPKLRPGFCLIIDGRQQSMRYFRCNLKRRYAFTSRINHANSIFILRR